MTTHVAVWLDHKGARIVHLEPDGSEKMISLTSRSPDRENQAAADETAKEPPDDAKRFFDEVARSVDDSDKLLLVGPASTKLEFMHYLHAHERALEPKVIAVETIEHPTDAQLVSYAKTYFAKSHRGH